MRCQKCKGEMEEGIIGDLIGTMFTVATQPHWGSRILKSLIRNPHLENKVKVITYKCKECGYLESYAK